MSLKSLLCESCVVVPCSLSRQLLNYKHLTALTFPVSLLWLKFCVFCGIFPWQQTSEEHLDCVSEPVFWPLWSLYSLDLEFVPLPGIEENNGKQLMQMSQLSTQQADKADCGEIFISRYRYQWQNMWRHPVFYECFYILWMFLHFCMRNVVVRIIY